MSGVAQFVDGTTPLNATTLNTLVVATGYRIAGAVPTTAATLTLVLPTQQVVVNPSAAPAVALLVFPTSQAVTASRDTYFDLVAAGTYTQVAVANGAAPPAQTANSTRLWKVVSGASSITAVQDIAATTPQATAPGIRQIVTGNQINTTSFTGIVVANWAGTPTVAITTQAGGSLRVRLTLPIVVTAPANTLVQMNFFCNVDGANLASLLQFGTRTDASGTAYTTAVGVWTTAVAPGPHSVKLQAQMFIAAHTAAAQESSQICLEVEEYA